MKTYSFENLESWKNAKQLAIWVYTITKVFPPDERFGLVSQMRRAAISVASNLAEGTSRKGKNDQARFSTIAYSSCIELLNDLIIVNSLQIISNEQYLEGRLKVERQTFLIARLRKSQLAGSDLT
jgi:four helix bundle protein